MKKFLAMLVFASVLLSGFVLAESKLQPGSQGHYLGEGDENSLGRYSIITGNAVYNIPIFKKNQEEVENAQKKVVKNDKILLAGESVTVEKAGVTVVNQDFDSDGNLRLLVTISKTRLSEKSTSAINFGKFSLLFREGKVLVPATFAKKATFTNVAATAVAPSITKTEISAVTPITTSPVIPSAVAPDN